MSKKALIYGISGQDGYYLSKFLSDKGYEVAGAGRSKPAWFHGRFYACDFARSDGGALFPLEDFSPGEIYNFAGISSVIEAERSPALADAVNAGAVEAILSSLGKTLPSSRFFQASSSYIFSGSRQVNEESSPNPFTAYGKSKLAASLAVSRFRDKGLFACSGILFNHESPRRAEGFVTRKISMGAAKIKLGLESSLSLGSLDARRDWGFAGDYVEAMWLMLQQKQPEDYIIATGEAHTVREFCQEAFSHAGLDWQKYVKSDASLVRASDPGISADVRKIAGLGWKPKVPFKNLVCMMVDSDIKRLSNGGIP